MESSQVKQSESLVAEKIRVKGTVQGVGFRPTVYRLAKECGLRGTVGNDGQGVLILAIATSDAIDTFVARLQAESPPLAKIAEKRLKLTCLLLLSTICAASNVLYELCLSSQ